jgi:hypothetical protein
VAPGATQEERDAMRFQAIKANFDWSNEEWASTWLPWVRSSVALLELDDKELKDFARDLVKKGRHTLRRALRRAGGGRQRG